MNYFFAPQASEGIDFLDEEESAHAVKVLRIKEGDHIGLLDGKGGDYLAIVNSAHSKKLQYSVLNKTVSSPPSYSIHIIIAPTKNADRMEWMVEKLTEIGVNQISFFYSQNSERRKYRIDRLEKKIQGALKQSKNPFLPHLKSPEELDNILAHVKEEQKFIAHVDLENSQTLLDNISKGQSVAVLIGPEGDFTLEEVKKAESYGFKKITLGKNVLRTETAGIIACHTIHLKNSTS